MVIDCEEVPEAVGVVEVGVGEHAIVNICQIDAEGLRILREEPRRTRVEQDGRVIGLDERGEAPLAAEALSRVVVHEYRRLHGGRLPIP